MKAIATLLSLLLVLRLDAVSEQRQRPVVRVAIDVTAPQEIRGQIISYLTRELRKIDDVIVTDSRPFLSIHCVALKSYNRGGYNIGYALAFATTSSMPATMTMLIAAPKLPQEDARYLAGLNTNQGVLVDFFVQICGPEDLPKICRDLAAKIDGEQIESARQFAQRYIDAAGVTSAQDDLRSAPSVAPLPGFTIETVEERKHPEASQPQRKMLTVTVPANQELHVRSEHTSRSRLIAALHRGDRIYAEPETFQNNDPPLPIKWQKVTTTKGETGWVNAEYLSSEE